MEINSVDIKKVDKEGLLEATEPSDSSESMEESQDLHEAHRLIDHRYRIIRRLGQGGMGSVHLVEDLLNPGLQLALKQIRRDRSDPKSVAILKNEFLALSPLMHPNLARVYDFGFDRKTEEYYFTSEYVRGIQLFKATNGLSLKDVMGLRMLLYLFVDIFRALDFIHSRGLVHGDLKPENILVSTGEQGDKYESMGGVQVKLIDFGLTKKEKDFGGKKIFGTSCYIAPETILGSQVDRRTDLYSIGVVLYQMAARKLPFSGKSNFMVLKGHLEDVAPPPQKFNPDIPEELGEIILRLMAKKPSDRYPNAISVIEDINERLSTRFPLESPETLRSYLNSPKCIARSKILGEFEAYFQMTYPQSIMDAGEDLHLYHTPENEPEDTFGASSIPSGRFFLIRGEEKIGKRKLLSDFKTFAEVRGAHFLEIGIEEAEEPSKKNLKKLLGTLAKVFSDSEDALQTSLMKLLKSLPRSLDEVDADKTNSALEVLVDGLLPACKDVSLILVFSDLHNAEEAFLKFLRILVEKIAQSEQGKIQMMILATVLEEKIENVNLRRLLLSPQVRTHFREIPLERFSREEIKLLLDNLFDPNNFSAAFIDRIHEESDGNPGVINEILEYFIDHGRLNHNVDGWSFNGKIESESLPGKVRSELKTRIQGLDTDAKKLGLAFAFLGNSCELDIAAQLAGIAPSKILSTLFVLKGARILREDGEGKADIYSFTHRSARELFCQLATKDQQVKIHRKAGAILEGRFNVGKEKDAHRLAYHFLHGNQPQFGIPYSLQAAREYTSKNLPREALNIYREMRELCKEEQIPELRDVDYQIAKLEALMGNSRHAAEILQWLVDTAHECEEQESVNTADILTDLGLIHCRLGEFRQSGRCFQEAYKLLKKKTNSLSFLRLLLGYGCLFQVRGNFLESFRYGDKVLSAPRKLDDFTQSRLYLLTAENHFQLNDAHKAISSCCNGLRLLDGYKEHGYVGHTFFSLGKYYHYKGKYDSAVRQFALATKAYRQVGLVEQEADCYHEIGKMSLILGDPVNARKMLLRAQEMYERIENIPSSVENLKFLGEAHRLLGRYEEAEDFLKSAMVFINKHGLTRKLRFVHNICARICLDRGHLIQALDFLNPEGEENQNNQCSGEVQALVKLELQCQIALLRGDYRRSLDLSALGTIRAREMKNNRPVIPILHLRARQNIILGRLSEAQRSLNQFLELGQKLKLPIEIARAGVLGGKLNVARGELEEASSVFDKALKIFKEKESERELAELYLEMGLLEIQRKDFEKSYVFLDEGFYLAKKLNLVYLRCQYLQAMGKLESVSPEGEQSRAINYFQSAFKLASKFTFLDLQWQIHYGLGKLFFDNKIYGEAVASLGTAKKLLDSLLEKVPQAYHDSFCKVTGAEYLENLLEQAKAHSDPQAATQKSQQS